MQAEERAMKLDIELLPEVAIIRSDNSISFFWL
jgi:hypothetical protein